MDKSKNLYIKYQRIYERLKCEDVFKKSTLNLYEKYFTLVNEILLNKSSLTSDFYSWYKFILQEDKNGLQNICWKEKRAGTWG